MFLDFGFLQQCEILENNAPILQSGFSFSP